MGEIAVPGLAGAVRAGLHAAANPAKAPDMQRYMKSAMPYLGVQTPALRLVCRSVFAEYPVSSFDQWQTTVRALWHEAAYREERYAALALVDRHPSYVTLEALPLLEELIVDGAWWDYVDNLAHYVGNLLLLRREELSAAMRGWSRSENLWKRRVSIICQVGRKAETDLRLLYDCIEPNLAEREFFIRKAIGWALRDYAWYDPHEVERYVAEHADRLSPLSRREATKNLVRLLSREAAARPTAAPPARPKRRGEAPRGA